MTSVKPLGAVGYLGRAVDEERENLTLRLKGQKETESIGEVLIGGK